MFDYLLVDDDNYLYLDNEETLLIIDEYAVITVDGIIVIRGTFTFTADGHIVLRGVTTFTADGDVIEIEVAPPTKPKGSKVDGGLYKTVPSLYGKGSRQVFDTRDVPIIRQPDYDLHEGLPRDFTYTKSESIKRDNVKVTQEKVPVLYDNDIPQLSKNDKLDFWGDN